MKENTLLILESFIYRESITIEYSIIKLKKNTLLILESSIHRESITIEYNIYTHDILSTIEPKLIEKN